MPLVSVTFIISHFKCGIRVEVTLFSNNYLQDLSKLWIKIKKKKPLHPIHIYLTIVRFQDFSFYTRGGSYLRKREVEGDNKDRIYCIKL